MKGIGIMVPNLLPDTTYNDKQKERVPGANAAVGRRFLKDIIADRRKQGHYNADFKFFDEEVSNADDKMVNNDDEEMVNKDNENRTLARDHPEIDYALILKKLRKRVSKLSSRRSENHKAVDKSIFLKYQSDRKMEEIKNFLDKYYLATDYIYDEVQRIKRDRVVKDPLRNMVDYLSELNRTGKVCQIQYLNVSRREGR